MLDIHGKFETPIQCIPDFVGHIAQASQFYEGSEVLVVDFMFMNCLWLLKPC